MDGWPGWKLTMRTAEEVEAAEKEVEGTSCLAHRHDTGLGMRNRSRYRLLLRRRLGSPDLQQNCFTLVD